MCDAILFAEDTQETLQLLTFVVRQPRYTFSIGKNGTAWCVLTHVFFHAASDAKQFVHLKHVEGANANRSGFVSNFKF